MEKRAIIIIIIIIIIITNNINNVKLGGCTLVPS